MSKYILFIVGLLLMPVFEILARESITVSSDTVKMSVYFRQGSSMLNPSYRKNSDRMTHFVERIKEVMVDSLCDVHDMEITASASPEGGSATNNRLCRKRSAAVCNYLISALNLPKSKFNVKMLGEDWQGLRKLVLKKKMPHAREVANIIKNVPIYVIKNGAIVDGREKRLMELDHGKVWRYMLANIFPELRSGNVDVTCRITRREAPVMPAPVKTDTVAHCVDTVTVAEAVCEPDTQVVMPKEEYNTILAIKTNLLYDLLTAINIEVEIPLSKRISLDVEYVNPWWSFGKGYTLKLLEGGIEGRYWFGDREKYRKLAGWFAGVFAGAGEYDLEVNNSGADGRYFVMGGVSGGYAHRISKHFGLEYGLGLGYLYTKYHSYDRVYDTQYGDIKVVPEPWHEKTGNWIGPLKAKVSLVWYLDIKKKGGKQ